MQAKVEYLTSENERLNAALASSREEVARLSALVSGAAHAAGIVPGVGVGALNGVGVGALGALNGVSVGVGGMPQVGVRY